MAEKNRRVRQPVKSDLATKISDFIWERDEMMSAITDTMEALRRKRERVAKKMLREAPTEFVPFLEWSNSVSRMLIERRVEVRYFFDEHPSLGFGKNAKQVQKNIERLRRGWTNMYYSIEPHESSVTLTLELR